MGQIIIENNQERRRKYAREFKNQPYNNYDEEAYYMNKEAQLLFKKYDVEGYSRIPNLYIEYEVFEKLEKDVKKIQYLLREITQNMEQFLEHLQ